MESLCLSSEQQHGGDQADQRQPAGSRVQEALAFYALAAELSTATVSLHDGRLEVDARYAIANTAEAIIALVKVGALVNLSFISRT